MIQDFSPYPSRLWIASALLALPWAMAVAQNADYPSTAAEIEQALQPVPLTRSWGTPRSRGLEDIVDDPPVYSSAVDTSSYTALEGLPKASARIHFDFDSAQIRSDAYPLLNEYVKALQGGLSDAKLVIAGHTDDTGSENYNWNLSRRRAQAIEDYLVGHGIGAERLVVKAYGESQPVASNDTENGRIRNRRVEFIRVDETQ